MKLPGVTSDVEQALSHTFLLTVGHNSLPIFLTVACAVAFCWAFYRPTRGKLLLFLGLFLLLGYVEYVKHVMQALKDQTLITTTTVEPRYRFIWFTERVVTKIIPYLLMFGGGFATLGSFVLLRREREKSKSRD